MSADAYFPITGPACAELERAGVEHIRALDLATSPMITAWGRRVTDEASRRCS